LKNKKYGFLAYLVMRFSINFIIILNLVLNIENGMNKLFEEPANLVETMEKIFKTKTQAEWVEVFQGNAQCCNKEDLYF
jgi:hypothetical protein